MRLRRIVITGGPGSGKTTVMSILLKHFAGKIFIVPETPTLLIEAGVSPPGQKPERDPLYAWQREIWNMFHALESQFEQIAEARGIYTLVYDRGPCDGAAYVHDHGGEEAFYRDVAEQEKTAVMERFDLVIHLESVAVMHPSQYCMHEGNEGRFESDPEIVASLCRRTYAAWQDHPNLCYLPYAASPEDKASQVIALIEALMSS